jgi:uncharacterized membrane protein YdjX (TVP38/TMEM64 family)
MRKHPDIAKAALVLLVLSALLAAYRWGLFERLAEPKVLADNVLQLGVWGGVAFVLTYTALQPFGVPGTIFIIAAPLIWPWPTAFVLSMLGTMGASVVGFAFARFVARGWVSARIPTRFRQYEQSLLKNGFQTVFILRLVLWMPQPLHSFFGVSPVGFWTHFFGSLLGYIPPLLAVSYLGARMFDASGRIQPGAWPILLGFGIASAVVMVASRMYQRRRMNMSE